MAETAHSIPGRKLLLGLLALVVIATAVIVVPSFIFRPKDKPLPDQGTVTAFSLVDERNQVFTEDAFRGHVTIVGFIFTRCDLACPIISMKMERIQEKTFDVGDKIKLTSFSLDPTYDTPERLAEYAKRYHAQPDRWRFVTGPFDKVHAVIEGPLMTSMMREQDRPTGVPNIQHREYFLLVDQKLHIRGIYDSDRVNQLDALIHDARQLARTGS